MPPKRARAAKEPSVPSKRKRSAATTQKPARSARRVQPKTSDAEIRAAFRQYAVAVDELSEDRDGEDDEDYEDDAGEGVVRIKDLRRCLGVLKLPPPPLDFFPPGQRAVVLPHFLALAQTLRDSAAEDGEDGEDAVSNDEGDEDEETEADEAAAQAHEIDTAFALFTKGPRITLADLRRVAKDLREDIDESTLRLMVEEATGDRGGMQGVGRAEFEGIMRRAGVFT